jgi:hypothetical protein
MLPAVSQSSASPFELDSIGGSDNVGPDWDAIDVTDLRRRRSPAASSVRSSSSSAALRPATDDDDDDRDEDKTSDGVGAAIRDRCCQTVADSSVTASSATDDGAETRRHVGSSLRSNRRHRASNVSKVSFRSTRFKLCQINCVYIDIQHHDVTQRSCLTGEMNVSYRYDVELM